MRILFVRHGHPDYAHDCLTELGHRHAAAAALRLQGEGIRQIYTSTCGRASETAEHTAQLLGLPVIPCDFMREINWGAAQGAPLPHDGHPWTTADGMVARGEPLLDPAWAAQEPFCRNVLVHCTEHVAAGLDAWLHSLGYTREGLYYRVSRRNDDTVAVFCHGGSSSAMISRLFNLPFPFACCAMGLDYTGITAVDLSGGAGALVTPKFVFVNNARHIQGMTVENYFGK